MKKKLQEILNRALEKSFQAESLKGCPIPNYTVEVPNHTGFGHFATNLPLLLASIQGRPPREIAKILVANISDQDGLIEKTDIAGPGFINFTIARREWCNLLAGIVSSGAEYGRSDVGNGKRVVLEFVSANPTGPLHLGHGRGAALGDTLCRMLRFCGFDVTSEFYINDAGGQIRLLGESIFSRWKQRRDPSYPFPEKGYHGEYILDLAEEISREQELDNLSEDEAILLCSRMGKEKMLNEIRADLEDFRVHFDAWSSESDLYASGLLDQSLQELRKRGMVYEKDGAVWIRTTDYGDDKDRVIRKKDGQYTYFASDISYHLQKWSRGFTGAINIWGADHHGYVQRVKAALTSSGVEKGWLSILLIQLVKLWKGGQEVKMSKRAGQYVTLKELLEEVGVDAARFVFLTKNHDTTLDFDVDLVKRQESDNPVYYVQYAHARICSIFRKAAEEGLSTDWSNVPDLGRLMAEEEMALIRNMAEFPSLLEEACSKLEPHRLTYYLADLAGLFHKYFNMGTKNGAFRVIHADEELSRARLFLAHGLRIVLENGLRLLGITAPEKM
ncbi:MAG: arginine--tRNA ligase [Desulfobacteraceae bacterium]|nr:MAG: arginine--tRNA ligase [Desulfobacteraceae bacterium]